MSDHLCGCTFDDKTDEYLEICLFHKKQMDSLTASESKVSALEEEVGRRTQELAISIKHHDKALDTIAALRDELEATLARAAAEAMKAHNAKMREEGKKRPQIVGVPLAPLGCPSDPARVGPKVKPLPWGKVVGPAHTMRRQAGTFYGVYETVRRQNSGMWRILLNEVPLPGVFGKEVDAVDAGEHHHRYLVLSCLADTEEGE